MAAPASKGGTLCGLSRAPTQYFSTPYGETWRSPAAFRLWIRATTATDTPLVRSTDRDLREGGNHNFPFPEGSPDDRTDYRIKQQTSDSKLARSSVFPNDTGPRHWLGMSVIRIANAWKSLSMLLPPLLQYKPLCRTAVNPARTRKKKKDEMFQKGRGIKTYMPEQPSIQSNKPFPAPTKQDKTRDSQLDSRQHSTHIYRLELMPS